MAKAKSTATGAETCDELMAAFMECFRKDDIDGMMALYYQKGASKRIRDLYRGSCPRPHEQPISHAEILDVAYSGECYPGRDPSTLAPLKVLAIRFGKKDRKGLYLYGQRFYIGEHKGRFYFVMPSSERRPEAKPTRAGFNKIIAEVVAVLLIEVPRVLNEKSSRLKDPSWTSAFLDERWTTDGDTSVSKLRVTLPSGKIFPRIKIPDHVGQLMGDIGDIKDRAFKKKWFGLKITVYSDGSQRLDFDDNPECAVDPDFFLD